MNGVCRLLACFALLSLRLATCEAYTFWVDHTCSSRAEWATALEETFTMARRAHERLSSETDTDFEAVFERLFKVEKSNKDEEYRMKEVEYEEQYQREGESWTTPPDQTAFNLVNSILKSIANDWHEVTTEEDRVKSDIRFYCGNDNRWVPCNPKSTTPTDLCDNDNHLTRKPGTSVCGQSGGVKLLGKTFTTRPLPYEGPHASWRCAITICERTFERKTEAFVLWKDILDDNIRLRNGKNIPDLEEGIDAFDTTIAGVILHEMTHSPYYSAMDENGPGSYGFDNIVMMDDVMQLVNNADNYAVLGSFAMVADLKPHGATLMRTDPGSIPIDPAEAAKYEQQAAWGMLAFYPNLTKRWLKLVAKAFQS